jgi:ribonucleoside-diphosphate reductase alpha chain
MSLRSGIMPIMIVKQLQGIRTSTPTLNKGMIVYSVPDAVAKILKKHLELVEQQIKLLPEGPKNEPKPELSKEPVIVEEVMPIVEEVKDESKDKYSKTNEFGDLFECPECGSDLEYAEGCILCRSCGYSKCG